MKVDLNDLCPCGSGLKYKKCCQDEENETCHGNPQALIAARFAALQTGEYEKLYATYHPESPFLQQFADRGAYVRFAGQHLDEIKLVSWQALECRQLDAQRVEQILVMEIAGEGEARFLYELALLVKTGAGWRYHSAQKLSDEDYSGSPERLDFHHFDIAPQKIRY